MALSEWPQVAAPGSVAVDALPSRVEQGWPRGTSPERPHLRAVPDDPHDAPPAREVVVTAGTGMRIRAPRWLYAGRIPTDAITLLAGREGIGKSTIAFDIAARVTRGQLDGRYAGEPRGVGVVASEDSWESVILPRLIAARADMSRVYRIEARTEEGRFETISAPADLDRLAAVCAEHDIALNVLDPIMSVIHGSIDTHKDREVRKALDPLAKFCADHEIAVLGLIHVNKSSTTDPLNSIMASRGFSAVARSVLYCIVDPEAEDEDRYLFGHPKCNNGPKQATVAYRLAGVTLEVEAEDPRDAKVYTSRVVWGDEDRRSIRDVLEGPAKKRASGELGTSIVEWIAAQGRVVAAAEIIAEFSDEKPGTLGSVLTRLVKRNELTRPIHGHYAIAGSGTQPCTPLETSEVQEVQDLQGYQDQSGTSCSSGTLAGAGTVPEPMQDADLWAGQLDEPPDWTAA